MNFCNYHINYKISKKVILIIQLTDKNGIQQYYDYKRNLKLDYIDKVIPTVKIIDHLDKPENRLFVTNTYPFKRFINETFMGTIEDLNMKNIMIIQKKNEKKLKK